MPSGICVTLHTEKLQPGIMDIKEYETRYVCSEGTAVAQWLRRCATNRKVAASIPDGVIGIFH